MRAFPLACATLATLVLVGQGCKKAPNTTAKVDTVAVAPPPPPPPLAVQGVDLGKSVDPTKRVTAPTTTFGVRDTIYASVNTTGVSSNASLAARWGFGDQNKLVDSTAVAIAPTGPAVTEFHIMRNSAWPVGKYRVTIYLDGQQVSDKEFEIKR
jgi:hypothetical protein